MRTITLQNGIKLHYIDGEKFKTFSLGIYFFRPLSRSEATQNALLSQVMKSGCEKYPTRKEIAQHLELLYGAGMGIGVRKKGEAQILSFSFEALRDEFTGENTTDKILDFAQQVIYHPKISDGAFDEADVEIEKVNLRNYILSMMNDKREFANRRLTEIMCAEELYGISDLGVLEDIPTITAKKLCDHYRNVVSTSRIEIFVCGDVDENKIANCFGQVACGTEMAKTERSPMPAQLNTVEESFDVTQGKLVIGFKTDYDLMGDAFFDLMVFNSVYGSGTHSKLFNNVRERLSLAYYAYSRIIKQKGIMMVATGIEFDKYEPAKTEIFAQLEAMCNGDVTEQEMRFAKNSIINAYRSLKDSPPQIEDYYLMQILAGDVYIIDQAIEKIENVKMENVIKAAKSFRADTIYFLKGGAHAV